MVPFKEFATMQVVGCPFPAYKSCLTEGFLGGFKAYGKCNFDYMKETVESIRAKFDEGPEEGR